jgi:hypothetical protein
MLNSAAVVKGIETTKALALIRNDPKINKGVRALNHSNCKLRF